MSELKVKNKNEGDEVDKRCRVCGCTDSNACDGGCFWIAPDLCSVCYYEMIDDDGAVEVV